MAKALTERQQSVFDFINAYIAEHDYPPTLREIQVAHGFNYLRVSAVHLAALERKGYIALPPRNNGPRATRGIRVLVKPNDSARDIERGFLHLPLIETGTPGMPVLRNDNVSGTVPVHVCQFHGLTEGCVLVRVKDDGLSGLHITRGDIAIAKPMGRPSSGDIVAARVEDALLVRKYHRQGNAIHLMPVSRDYAPVPLRESDDGCVIGHVIGIMREMKGKDTE